MMITKRKPHVPGGRPGHPVGVPCNHGETNGQAKLTAAQVWAIRDQREQGGTYAAIAARFGVGYTTVWKICNQQAWWHLRTPLPPPPEPLPCARYVHAQPIAAAVWMVVHNLGFQPHQNIVVDLDHRVVFPGEIEHLDSTALVVRFSTALAGEIHCS